MCTRRLDCSRHIRHVGYKAPVILGGFVDIMECLFFPLSWCCTYDVKGGSFCACLFCPPSQPLSVLPGNSNTLWGLGLIKRMNMNMTSSALRLVCWHRCSFETKQKKPPFPPSSLPLPLRPGPPRTDLCPAAHCLIRSLLNVYKKNKELKYASCTLLCDKGGGTEIQRLSSGFSGGFVGAEKEHLWPQVLISGSFLKL